MNIANLNNLQFETNKKNFWFDKTEVDEKYSDFYMENDFIAMLSHERKRSRRTKKPFILMLINIKSVLQMKLPQNKTNAIVCAIRESTREIDIKGWYKKNSTLGVVFVGIEEPNIYSAKEIIARKFENKLITQLNRELLDMLSITYHIFPEKYEVDTTSSPLEPALYPDLSKTSVSKMTCSILKRSVDVIGSIVGLLLFLPLFLVISALVKLTSTGPVFFKQPRLGQFGKAFTFYKFRTMLVNNDESIHREYVSKLIEGSKNIEQSGNGEEKSPAYKIKSDPRITPLGRFLRKTSLDELPQFLNVLKGDMSLVGPRPPIPYEFEKYAVWHRERLLRMKPGITGLWQVMGRSSTSFDDMVRLDVKYLREWSLWLDIVIIAKTPWVMVKGKGAY